LFDALHAKDEASALQLLSSRPTNARQTPPSPTRTTPPAMKLGWVRDDMSGGYAAHIAAWHGLGKVLLALMDSHGEQQGPTKVQPSGRHQATGVLQLLSPRVGQHWCEPDPTSLTSL
jgi:hypothetical protein